MVVDGQVTTRDNQLEEKLAMPAAALDKMFAMLGDLTDRMRRMESSQPVPGDHHYNDSSESSVFCSVLGSGGGMNLQALEHYPPPRRGPNVSPATHFGTRQPAIAEDHMVDTPARAGINYGMAQNNEPAHQAQADPAGVYPNVQTPGPMFYQHGQVPQDVLDGRQTKLALQPFDGKELYHELGSGFLE